MTMPAPQPHAALPQPFSHAALSWILAPFETSKLIPCQALSCTRLLLIVTLVQPTSHHTPTPELLLTSLLSTTKPETPVNFRPAPPQLGLKPASVVRLS